MIQGAILIWTLFFAGGSPTADLQPEGMQPADMQLVERILSESGVETQARRVSLTEYLSYLFTRLQEAIADFFAWASNFAGGFGSVLLWTGRILVGAAALAVLLGLAVFILRVSKRAAVQETPPEEGPLQAAPLRILEAQAWREEIDRRLDSEGVPQALEAVWWWLARSLAGERADASWTSRDLTRQCRRADLSPLLRRLDAMIYGTALPSPSGVRHLVADAEGAL